MSSISEFRFAPAVRELTARIIAAQPAIPASPGAMVDGEPLLCLAACAAEAGFLVRGDQATADAFRKKAAGATDKAIIVAAFEQLGWSPSACDAAVKFNDSQAPAVRKARILEALAHT